MSIAVADIRKGNVHHHVLPCELCGVCAAESFYGFLQERADHLRKSRIYIRQGSLKDVRPSKHRQLSE